jgi:hypothetical protein
MANFKISGVWKNTEGAITHYAIHRVDPTSIDRGRKTSKVDAVRLLSIPGHTAITWLWDYPGAYWKDGAKVEVVNGQFLRTVHDGTVSDNLAHLIDYDWLP